MMMCKPLMTKEIVWTEGGNEVEVDVYTLVDTNKIEQWQIRYCDLGDADVNLKEIGKSRPCIIMQTNKYNNDEEATIYVIPLSASPMYNITSEKLVGIRIGSKISIICFNEMKSIHRSKIQNNIIADDIPDDIKHYIMEYFMQRLFGDIATKEYKTELTLETIPDVQDVSAATIDINTDDARAISLIQWMIESDFAITPENISTCISVENCGYVYKYYEKAGIMPFSNTKNFNTKTFKLAMARAKKRSGL